MDKKIWIGSRTINRYGLFIHDFLNWNTKNNGSGLVCPLTFIFFPLSVVIPFYLVGTVTLLYLILVSVV